MLSWPPDLSSLSLAKREERDEDTDTNDKAEKRLKATWGPRSFPGSKELDLNQGSQLILQLIRKQARLYPLAALRRLQCAAISRFQFNKAQQKLLEVIEDDVNFERQGGGELVGSEFYERLSLVKLRSLVETYQLVWSSTEPEKLVNGKWNLDDREGERIMQVVVAHVDTFLPMIRALFDAGYVKSDHRTFELLYRFQDIRHRIAGVWHMDYNNYQTYADDGTTASRWTESGSRAVVTSACVNMRKDPEAPEFWHNCGTRVALGVPVLKANAMNEIVDVVYDESAATPECTDLFKLRNRVITHMMDATERALIEFSNNGGVLESAGIRTLTLENGVVSNYNDFMFHQANSDVPEGYSRVFFVMSGRVTKSKTKVEVFDTERNKTYELHIASI